MMIVTINYYWILSILLFLLSVDWSGNMYRKPLYKMGKPMVYCILKCFPSTNPVNLLSYHCHEYNYHYFFYIVSLLMMYIYIYCYLKINSNISLL